MIDIQSKITEVVETSIEHAQRTADLFKSEWAARWDIAKNAYLAIWRNSGVYNHLLTVRD